MWEISGTGSEILFQHWLGDFWFFELQGFGFWVLGFLALFCLIVTGDYVVAGVAYSRIRTRTRLLAVSLYIFSFLFFTISWCYASVISFPFSFNLRIWYPVVSLPLLPILWMLILAIRSMFVLLTWNCRSLSSLSFCVTWICRKYENTHLTIYIYQKKLRAGLIASCFHAIFRAATALMITQILFYS